MKKINKIVVLSLLISTLFIVKDVMASSLEELKDSEDYNSIYNIANEIVEFVNNGPTSSSGGRDITIKDIDFNNAIKEYLDTPLIENEIIDYSEVMNALNESPYMWIVSIRADNILYEVCITKARDENDKQTGSWGVEGVYVYEPGNLTLIEQLSASLEKNSIGLGDYEFILVGGVSPVRQPVFIALDGEKISYIIPARTSAAAVITDSRQTRSNQYADKELEPSDPEGFQAYDYKSVMKAAADVSKSIGQGGGTAVIDIGIRSRPYGLYIGIIIVAAIVIAVVCRKRKRHKNIQR